LPVHIVQGFGISHWKTMTAKTAIVHTSTRAPTIATLILRRVLCARRYKNNRTELFDMLTAKTNIIVETKSLRSMLSKSLSLKRHLLFPRPQSKAIEMIAVLARAQNPAMKMTTSPDEDRWRRCANLHRAMILAIIERACISVSLFVVWERGRLTSKPAKNQATITRIVPRF